MLSDDSEINDSVWVQNAAGLQVDQPLITPPALPRAPNSTMYIWKNNPEIGCYAGFGGAAGVLAGLGLAEATGMGSTAGCVTSLASGAGAAALTTCCCLQMWANHERKKHRKELAEIKAEHGEAVATLEEAPELKYTLMEFLCARSPMPS